MKMHRDSNPLNYKLYTDDEPLQCTSCNSYHSNKNDSLIHGCNNCIDTFSKNIPNDNDFARYNDKHIIAKNNQ